MALQADHALLDELIALVKLDDELRHAPPVPFLGFACKQTLDTQVTRPVASQVKGIIG
jgi:hypothetical protein